jgi:hypothetical protein
MLPINAGAQAYPDVIGYYYGKANLRVIDMQGDTIARFPYIGIMIGDQTDNAFVADDCYIDLYYTGNSRGCTIANGTGVCNRIRLLIGSNTVTVTDDGTFTVTLATGVTGTATTGTSTVAGSPQTLVVGENTVTTTGEGTFTLALALDPITIGTLAGVVGDGSKARIQAIGTSIIGSLADGTGTATGAPITLLPGNTVITVTVQGTFTATLPYGCIGTATSGTCTVTNSPLDLVAGDNTITITGTGDFTINLQVTTGYTLSGRIRFDKEGDVHSIKGRLEGFIVLDNDPWTVLTFGNNYNCRWEELD